MRLVSASGLWLWLMMLPSMISAQLAPPASGGGLDATYEQRYADLKELQAVPNRVAHVSGLVIKRDAGQFTFENGKFYLLTPIGGRTMGAVFLGTGRMAFNPPSRIEQERLARFQKAKSLDAPFSSVVLLFADSTLAELEAKLTFGPGQPPEQVRQRFKASLDNLIYDDSKSLDPDLMSAFLNGESSGLFYAEVNRTNGGSPLMFMINPSEVESVSLSHRVRRYGWTRQSEAICRFQPEGMNRSADLTGERVRQATIRHYAIQTSLAQSSTGDLSFVAGAKLEITSNAPMGPWVAFSLFEKLKVDSARWEGGEPATVFKGKDGPLLWVRLDGQLQPGDVRTLSLYYHGDLIDRFDDFFFIKSSAEWYPRSLEGRSLATFDLTFRSPKGKLLASVGDKVDSSTAG
jgi:hypothetical protein